MRTEGLARLLVLEKLPKSEDRESYLQTRRAERGRPPLSEYLRRRQGRELHGNIKDDWEDEVPEWQEEDQSSNYHTFVRGRFLSPRPIQCTDVGTDYPLRSTIQRQKDRKASLR